MGVESAKDKIIVALDVNGPQAALEKAKKLAPHVGLFKLGLQFINSTLASLITPEDPEIAMQNLIALRELFEIVGDKIFWDGKLHDIPNTILNCVPPLAQMKVRMFNVHVSADEAALREAARKKGQSLAIGVTVLTSLSDAQCQIVYGAEPKTKVLQFAKTTFGCGLDGVVCSPQEVTFIRQEGGCASGLLLLTPGVRPEWAAVGDQKRVMTPKEAIEAGADYLVIGRPITDPPPEIGGPVAAAQKIAQEIAEGILGRDV